MFGSRVHQEDQGAIPSFSVVRGGWHHARRAHPDIVDWQPHEGLRERDPQLVAIQVPANIFAEKQAVKRMVRRIVKDTKEEQPQCLRQFAGGRAVDHGKGK